MYSLILKRVSFNEANRSIQLDSNKKCGIQANSCGQNIEQTENQSEQQTKESSQCQNGDETTVASEQTSEQSYDTPFVPKFTDLQRKQLDEQLRNVIILKIRYNWGYSQILSGHTLNIIR